MIPVAEITPNPNQPRQTFSQESLQELAQSIRAKGVLQPVLVRPGRTEGSFELIAGERRLRASSLAGQERIPALVREISDEESFTIALIENLQREDLNPLEEALALERLKERLGLSQEELAGKVGRSRPAVANALRLLQLAASVQQDVREGRITAGHARAILAVPDHDAQAELSRRVHAKGLTVRHTEELAATFKKHGSFSPPRSGAPASDKPFQKHLKRSLSRHFPCQVQCRGDRRTGSITLSYSSADELETLLSRLGVDDEVRG